MIAALVRNLKSGSLFQAKDLMVMGAINAGYLLLSRLLIGFRSEQIFLLALVNGLYFLSFPTRKFITAFSIFIIYWVLFDYMKAFPNYRFGQVHIADLYGLEKRWFGIAENGHMLTPNEFWLRHQSRVLDVASGLFYLTWVPVPLMFGGYLFVKRRAEFFHFALSFLLINLLGFVGYYLFPAAPPWYVQAHGFQFIAGTPGNTAGLARFDAFWGVGIFKSLYEKSSNVFAAMPSLHSAYPLLVLYYGLRNRLGNINLLFAFIMLGIWFSAVYTSHHYILDVAAGVLCAIIGLMVYGQFRKTRWYGSFIKKMVDITS